LINGSKNSGASRPSEIRYSWREVAAVAGLAAILIAIAAAWFLRQGFLLYYGDAQAHLNIARSIIDSRTPGYEQIGSVWLPILHVICLPFATNDMLWSTGLAGTIPVAMCFVLSVTFFYLAAREAYDGYLPAGIVVACLALNPNLLYLGSIPMTEVVFLAAFSVMLFSLLRFRRTQSQSQIILGALASMAASLTRYDGWFLIPFFTVGFFVCARRGRFQSAVLFGTLASLAPLYWLTHNRWETGDPLGFYRGPYSAKAINGNALYPGFHDWRLAALYYTTAGRLCAGLPLLVCGAVGVVCAMWTRRFWPLLLLLLTPCFYIWSIESSGTPIHVPTLKPFSYYNTRYGIAMLPLAAFAVGAIVLAMPNRWRKWAMILPVIGILPWLIHPSHGHWICWKESEVNSNSRREWTADAAQFFKTHYRNGDGILMSFGDATGIFGWARIPLSETLHEGNGPAWLLATTRMDLFHPCKWAVAVMGKNDRISRAIDKANWRKTVYRTVLEIHTKDDPVVRIYRRVD
jgi:hypothetical protein